MGWISDAMLTNGIVSFDELANRMLSDEWPSSVRKLQGRSLGNNLRALDQGRELRWWQRRSALHPVVAGVLSMEVERVKQHVRGQSESVDSPAPSQSFELGELGGYRRLDLNKVELPPGLPDLLHRPRRWTRHRWHAPSDRIASLVGSWMTARGLAVHVAADTWKDVFARLPRHGSVLILCREHVDDRRLNELADAPELDGLSVCAATLIPWIDGEPTVSPHVDLTRMFGNARNQDWQPLPNAPLSAWRDELIAWAVKQIPKRRRPSVEAVLATLKRDELERRVNDADDVLDVVELLAVAPRALADGGSPERLAQFRARVMLAQAEAVGIPGTSLVKDKLEDLLESLLAAALSAGAVAWSFEWTRSDWASKIPQHVLPKANREALAMLAARDAPTLDVDERALLRHAIAPKATDVIDALAEVGYLERLGDRNRLRFPTRWFNFVAHERAIRSLLETGEVKTLGRVIRTKGHFDEFVTLLLGLHRSGDHTVAQRIVDTRLDGVRDPEVLVACKAATIAVGLATLVGSTPPKKLLQRCRASLKFLLLPCSGRFFSVVPLDSSAKLATPAVLSLVTLALTAAYDFGELTSQEVQVLTVASSDAIHDLDASNARDDVVLGAFHLGAKLVAVATEERFRALCGLGSALVWPACLVRSAKGSRNDFDASALDVTHTGIEKLNTTPRLLLAGIKALVRREPGQYASIVRRLWRVWAQSKPLAESPPIRWLQSAPKAAEEIWSCVRIEQKRPFLAELLRQRQWPAMVTRSLSHKDWRAWIEQGFTDMRSTFGRSWMFGGFWASVPAQVVGALVGDLQDSDRASDFSTPITEGWNRAPELLLEHVGQLPIRLAIFLATLAPEQTRVRVIPIIMARRTEFGERTVIVVGWLQEVMAQQPETFEHLFELRTQLLAAHPEPGRPRAK